MKITIDRSALFLRFSGRLSATKSLLLPLTGVEFSLLSGENGMYALVADSPAGHTLLAHFENEYDAVQALQQINGKLQRHFRARKAMRLARGVFWPLAAIALILSLNGALMNLRSVPPESFAAVTSQQAVPVSVQPQSAAPQLMNALFRAAKSGKFTVSLSEGKAHTLYVFSDPLCLHCRSFEPVLERLAADYNIEIFPVSLVGDDTQIAKSETINQFVLAAEKNERIQRWKKVLRGEVSAANAAPQSQEMAERVNANNQAFGLLGFTGTPSVLTEDGKEISLDAVKEPAQLAVVFAEKN